ncbi:MAG: glycosyltransferase [Planctomycetota bacterium]|nr:glycosyltransferase [Planctomycetota bacterium]
MSVEPNWQPLSLLASRFYANVNALSARYPALAQTLLQLPATQKLLSTATGQVRLGDRVGDTVRELTDPAPPASARQIVAKIYPTNHCTFPVCVAGLGYGWIWQQLYTLPVSTPSLPGYRPPLYFMANDVEQLHTMLHVHDWRAMLADERVQLFVGVDAFEQLERTFLTDTRIPWPKLAVTIEPRCWPAGKSFDGLVQFLFADGAQRLADLRTEHASGSAGAVDASIALRIERGEKLRILGITSRYTTFLQHSMRDWLDAFARMGHTTRLIIEDADHQVLNNIEYAQACTDFRPDLVVLIDHHRAEFNAIPDDIPCVMWVQDHLPNIFSDKAGAAQTDRDFCLGTGRLLLATQHGYPADRFMTAPVTVNETRFAPRELNAAESDHFGCDVSFVSHASMPADAIMHEQLQQTTDAGTKRLLSDVYDRLRAIYDADGCVSHPLRIGKLIEQSAAALRLGIDPKQMPAAINLFHLRINNALFRHQALTWLIDEGIDLRLYGRGWENHPQLGRFARGIADNHGELCTIYQASRINLQITPHGSVHQRLFEGVAAGAFFLLRAQPADEIDALYRPLAAWCEREQIADDADLRRRATPEVMALLEKFQRTMRIDPLALEFPLTQEIRLSQEIGFELAAASAIPQYDAVAFDSARQLRQKVRHYLANPGERQCIADAMRERVLKRYTYTAVTEQLLSMISTRLARTTQSPAAAAA